MEEYESLLKQFVQRSKEILGDCLVGIYLHGSAAMGCFHAEKSDLDLILVVQNVVSDEIKRKFMDMVVKLNAQAPAKGMELSVVREEVCRTFVYPTPFELHFSMTHLPWYRSDPDDYIEKMKGTDRDLAAHFTIIYHRGRVLYGKAIGDVFSEVDSACYFDSILYDIENAEEDIKEDPVYVILNLCRVLAYKRDRLILSKQEGGEWGTANIPEKYTGLIAAALEEYQAGEPVCIEEGTAREYVRYMLAQIKA